MVSAESGQASSLCSLRKEAPVASIRYGAHLEQAELPSLELASQAVGALVGPREHLSDDALSSGVSPSF